MKAFKFFLISGLALLVLSCQKADKIGGNEIRFTASANPTTKTAYGDYHHVDGVNPFDYQDINWVEGDQILIYSDKAVKRYNASQHYSIYDIVSIDPSSPNKAKLDNPSSDPNGLVYVEGTEEETYSFLGIYPPSQEIIDNLTSEELLAFTFPAVQRPVGVITEGNSTTYLPDMSYAYMISTTAEAPWKPYGNKEGTIHLQFVPAFTAFEITLRAEVGEIPLDYVTFYTDPDPNSGGGIVETKAVDVTGLGGLAGLTIFQGFKSGYDIRCDNPNPSVPLKFIFPEGTTISETKSITFTVFARPKRYYSLGMSFMLGTGEERFAGISQKEGQFESFIEFKKHRLYGLVMPDQIRFYASLEDMEYSDYNPINIQ